MRLIDADDIARWYSETHPVSIARINEMLVLEEIIKFMPSADAESAKHTKTADQMFRELGCEKVEDSDRYLTYGDRTSHTEIVYDKETNIVCCLIGATIQGLSQHEILACAQLIKEMEDSKNV